MIRLLFLVRQFDSGGAERQLLELVKALDKSFFAITVVVFYDGGSLFSELEAIPGVRVVSLKKKGRYDCLGFLQRLFRTMLAERPQVVYSFLPVANELGLLAGKVFGARVVWGLRSSNVDLSFYHPVVALVFRLGALLSHFPDLIIVNSVVGYHYHARAGYRKARMVTVHNGIDTNRFYPDPAAGRRIREEWGVGPTERMLGLVARLDPQKDHGTFLRAAALVHQQDPGTRFVCVGRDGGVPGYQENLFQLAADLGLGRALLWQRQREDVQRIYNALDVLVLSSSSEGFPNVVGEAMACAVPCVVTDVGDAAYLVGDTGLVVPPRDPPALARGILRLLAGKEARSQGQAARTRIEEKFSTAQLARATECLLRQVVSGQNRNLQEMVEVELLPSGKWNL